MKPKAEICLSVNAAAARCDVELYLGEVVGLQQFALNIP
jgi:hypothetical protein